MDMAVDETKLLESIRNYREQLRVNPSSDLFLPLAQCYFKLGLHEASLDAVKRGIEHNPDHILGLLFLADLLTESEEYDEAIVILERVLHLDAHNSNALIGLAQLDIRQHHYDRAQGHINQLASNDPDNVAIGELRAKIKSFKADRDDNVLLSTATMAELYLSQGLKEKAISIYRSLLEREPDVVSYQNKLNELLQDRDGVGEMSGKDQHAEGLRRWLIAIERRRKNV